MAKRFFIIIDGPMGSGKSTIAKLLHKELKRTAILGLDKVKWFVSDFQRNKKDNTIARHVVLAMVNEYIRHNLNILIDQGFKRAEYMDDFMKIAKKNKLPLYIFQLTMPRNVLLKRLKKRGTAKEANKPVPKTRILRNLREHERYKFGKAKIFDSSRLTVRQIVNKILEEIK